MVVGLELADQAVLVRHVPHYLLINAALIFLSCTNTCIRLLVIRL